MYTKLMSIHREQDQKLHDPKPRPHDMTVQVDETPINGSDTLLIKKEAQ